MSRLAGEFALVTGGSGGIGRAVCLALAREGARVTFTYRDETRAAVTRQAAEASGAAVTGVRAEMGDRSVIDAVLATAGDPDGALDVVVLNAGTTTVGACSELSLEEWDRVVDVNLSAPFRWCRAAIPRLRTGGRILMIGSTAHRQGLGPVHYVASKAGLEGMARALAREVASRSITVNTLCPGFVDTAFHGQCPEAEIFKHQASRLIPLGRFATPDEVASAALAILTNPYITGSSVIVAGGAVMA
ncbi:MAG: SDR family NAD(P)-dependent oxidoreductase [Acidimicrobiia bacterium]